MGHYSSIILLTIWGLVKSNADPLPQDEILDYQSMDHGEAVKFLQLSEIKSLKKRVADLEKEQAELIQNNLENMNNLNKEKDDMEKALTEKLRKSEHSCTNKNILVKFMRNILYHKNKKSSVCVKTIDSLTEKMKLQETLLEEYKELIAIQDASLKSLKPTLSYVVQNNSQYQYKTSPDGTLLEMVPCKCLPVTRDPAITFTSLEFSCPAGSVVVDSLLPAKQLACPDGECPFEIAEDVCGDYKELPWTEWAECTGDYCLYDSYRERKYRDTKGQIVSKVDGDGARPLVFNETEEFEVVLPAGQLGVFVVGGGGGADDTESGSSGFFTYSNLGVISSGTYRVSVLIGRGGYGDGRGGPIDGQPTIVDVKGVGKVEALGGGGRGQKGWSGGSSEKGGYNGESGQDKDNGSHEPLPDVCGDLVELSPGPTGRYDSDGTGGGGVVVNGMQPVHNYYRDGHGYGAGGGEDDHGGYDGVAVLVLCP